VWACLCVRRAAGAGVGTRITTGGQVEYEDLLPRGGRGGAVAAAVRGVEGGAGVGAAPVRGGCANGTRTQGERGGSGCRRR